MEIIALENDDFHHSVGKGNYAACPNESHTQFASSGAHSSPIIPSSLISESPPIFISPPSKQRILEQCQLEQDRQRSGMLGLFHKVLGKLQSHASNTIVVNNYYYQGLAFQANNNNYKNMQIIGSFNNWGTIQENNYYGGKEQQEEKTDAKVVDYEEVKTTPAGDVIAKQPTSNEDGNALTFMDCIADKETALLLKAWLHERIDKLKTPKPMLKYLTAAYEADTFTIKIPYEIYIGEFKKIASSSYYEWFLTDEVKYKPSEIDSLILQLKKYLGQIPK